MKNRLLFILTLFVSVPVMCQAQNPILWGMTGIGGRGTGYGGGVIFNYNATTDSETVVHDFGINNHGQFPQSSLIQASDSLLYGTTQLGGVNNEGTIFSYNISTGIYTDIHDFGNNTDGSFPIGSLIQLGNGLLYGMTSVGGAKSDGIIFSYNILTGTEIVLHNFGGGADGTFPYGSLIQANDSLLYGMTTQGGAKSDGAIFSYNMSTNNYIKLHDFGSGNDGSTPYGSLIQANDGLLYGTTEYGGTFNKGTIFSYNSATDTEIDIHNFGSSNDGRYPYGSLVQAQDSLLYGMTYNGGTNDSGTIFSFNISTDTETVLHNLGSGTDGAFPCGPLITSNGLLYGMTNKGGVNDSGTIISYNISSGTETVLHNFRNDSDGYYPNYGSLIQANNGLLYGMTSAGGVNNEGIILSYNITTSIETDIYDFSSGIDGQLPKGSIMRASNGLLYGMTLDGGTYSEGIIFSYNAATGVESDLYNFAGDPDGAYPNGSLIQATNGLLYGMTGHGGVYTGVIFGTEGVIFSYDISTGKETVLHDFGGTTNDGAFPSGSLFQAANGLLYGTTSYGGGTQLGEGTLFSYDISTGIESVLYDFGGTAGQYPLGSIIQANNGLLYGTTSDGGAIDQGQGTLFSYNISTGVLTDLYNFSVASGGSPIGSLVQASNGLLYGVNSGWGPTHYGNIFSYNISTGVETDIHDFGKGKDGFQAQGSLIQGSNGLLYGMTSFGGVYDSGMIFSYNIATASYTDVHDFTGIDGDNPTGDLFEMDTLYVTPSYTDICAGNSVTLTAGGVLIYTWAPATGLNTTTGESVTANPTATTTYTIMGSIGGHNYITTTIITVFPALDTPTIRVSNDSLISSASQGNQWYRNDTLIQGATNQVYISYDKGVHFAVAVTDSFGCSNLSNSVSITGIDQLSSSTNQLALYPNPSSNNIHFTLNLQRQQPIQLILYNILGQQMWSEDLGNVDEANATIPVINLLNGVYILKVNSGSESQQREVVVAR